MSFARLMRNGSVAAAAALVVATTMLSTAPAAAKTTSASVLSCLRHTEVKPADYVVTCANANTSWKHVTWSTWGSATATGRGDVYQNNCQPDCASGHFHTYAAKVVLSKIVANPKYGPIYSEATISYVVAGAKTSQTLSLRSGLHLATPKPARGDYIFPVGVSCELDYTPPSFEQVYCGRFKPPASVTMKPSGAAKRCSGDKCLGNPGEGSPTLAYGKSVSIGPFRCLSSSSGVVCTATTGRGFVFSRSSITKLSGY
jgi:hypothetical protein